MFGGRRWMVVLGRGVDTNGLWKKGAYLVQVHAEGLRPYNSALPSPSSTWNVEDEYQLAHYLEDDYWGRLGASEQAWIDPTLYGYQPCPAGGCSLAQEKLGAQETKLTLLTASDWQQLKSVYYAAVYGGTDLSGSVYQSAPVWLRHLQTVSGTDRGQQLLPPAGSVARVGVQQVLGAVHPALTLIDGIETCLGAGSYDSPYYLSATHCIGLEVNAPSSNSLEAIKTGQVLALGGRRLMKLGDWHEVVGGENYFMDLAAYLGAHRFSPAGTSAWSVGTAGSLAEFLAVTMPQATDYLAPHLQAQILASDYGVGASQNENGVMLAGQLYTVVSASEYNHFGVGFHCRALGAGVAGCNQTALAGLGNFWTRTGINYDYPEAIVHNNEAFYLSASSGELTAGSVGAGQGVQLALRLRSGLKVSRGAGTYADPFALSAQLSQLAVTDKYISSRSAELTGQIEDKGNLSQTLYYQLNSASDDGWQTYPESLTVAGGVYNFAGLDKLAIEGFGEGAQQLNLRTFNGQDYSAVASVAVFLDKSAPSLRATPESATWTENITSVKVSVSDPDLTDLIAGSGVSQVRYVWNDAAALAADCSSGGVVTANEVDLSSGVGAGTNILYLCARDKVGNVSAWQGTYYYQTAMAYEDIDAGQVLYFAGRRFVKIEDGYVWQGTDEERLAWDADGAALSFDSGANKQVAHWLNVAYLERLTLAATNGFSVQQWRAGTLFPRPPTRHPPRLHFRHRWPHRLSGQWLLVRAV
jgi:hypothetical protein